MQVITLKFEELADALKREGDHIHEIAEKACMAAALKYQAKLKQLSDELGITDLGTYKNSWTVMKIDGGAVILNDAPHAAIVEWGCRPHFVSREGREGLAAWARRKLQLNDKEAESASWAIAHNIAENGLKGRFVVRDSFHLASKFFKEEVERLLKEKH